MNPVVERVIGVEREVEREVAREKVRKKRKCVIQ